MNDNFSLQNQVKKFILVDNSGWQTGSHPQVVLLVPELSSRQHSSHRARQEKVLAVSLPLSVTVSSVAGILWCTSGGFFTAQLNVPLSLRVGLLMLIDASPLYTSPTQEILSRNVPAVVGYWKDW